MFESAPLVVPARVAEQVADDPADWVATLSAACRETWPAEEPISTARGHDFRLLTDVPAVVQQLIATVVADVTTGRPAVVESAADLAALELGLVRAALDDRLDALLAGPAADVCLELAHGVESVA